VYIGINIFIDIITQFSVILRLLGNNFQTNIFALCSEKNSALFAIKFPPIIVHH